MKVPFLGPSYQARSANVDAQRSVNCFLEMDNASPRAPVVLYGTPGMVLRFTLPTAPVREVIEQGDVAYVVAGDTVYHVTSAYVATAIGTIGTNSGPVELSSNGTQTLIVDGVGGWLATGLTLDAITDPDFPAGVTTCDFLDGFFIVGGNGSGFFYINETPNVGTEWNGTDFANAEGNPDKVTRLIVMHRELWPFGSASAEIWQNTGNPDFPLERSGNAFLETGTPAPWSVAYIDNTVFWLGADSNGAGMVFRAQGYTPQRISTHALEKAISGYATISDARAYCFQMEGHSFYVLTFPTANATWVYDAASGQWFEWGWRNPASGVLGRHRSNCHVFFNNEHLVGDFENGKVYALDLDTYTDNGDPILRLRTTQCMDSPNGARMFYEQLAVDMETGVGLATGQGSAPLLMMRYSNDGGHTWSNEKARSVGLTGEYAGRVRFGPTGSGRNRVWEISMTDPVKFAVLGAYLDATEGTS